MNTFPPIGSTYEWQRPGFERAKLPAGAKLFSTGRGALLAACRQISANATVWLPSYFCGDVADALAGNNVRVQTYEDLPTLCEPEWHTLRPRLADIVVAVNLFGVRDAKPWKKWQLLHRDITLIEDHTHDPLSDWAIHSTADYAFASLRKTVPISDGGVLWSPRKNPLATPTGSDFSPPAAYALAGMILKKSYLDTGADNQQLYDQMRLCQERGEQLMSSSSGGPISAWSRSFVSLGLPADLRRDREYNTSQFLQSFLGAPELGGVAPVFRDWPFGHCPLNPVLLFESHNLREACRQNLIRHRVFAAVHWPTSKWMTTRAADIATRMLTIPLDFRCRADGHVRIIKILRDSLTRSNAARHAA